MSILDVTSVQNWLDQFDPPDRYLAEHLISKMRYVSFQNVEAWLQVCLEDVIAEIEKEEGKVAIAVFPVTKPFIHEFNRDKDAKPANDSSGRIAHALRNLERRLPNRVELTPRVQSMKEMSVRHVIFVDDFVGTGVRFEKFWRQIVSRSLKSWCAFGWCKIWFISYAAHRQGLARICRNNQHIVSSRIRCELLIDRSFIRESRNLMRFCNRHGEHLSKRNGRFGFGNLLSPVVFQYGCPNNVPGLLWHKAKKTRSGPFPLFPNRSVPADLYSLFGEDHREVTAAEDLWLAKYYSAALRYIERPDDFSKREIEITVLAYLAAGRSASAVRALMVLSERELDSVLSTLSQFGLVDGDFVVTRFGKEILRRGGKKARVSKKVTQNEYLNYFPAKFLGFQREI